MTDIEGRFWAKASAPHPVTGCRIWTASKTVTGYGFFVYKGKTWLAHRAAWDMFVGPIPDGMTIDHYVCDDPSCVEVTHLRLATLRDNILRSGTSLGAVNARKTECKRGHPLSGANLRVSPDGRRICRECKRQQTTSPEMRAYKAAWYRDKVSRAAPKS